jgi:Ca2+/Na+ antiporter
MLLFHTYAAEYKYVPSEATNRRQLDMRKPSNMISIFVVLIIFASRLWKWKELINTVYLLKFIILTLINIPSAL